MADTALMLLWTALVGVLVAVFIVWILRRYNGSSKTQSANLEEKATDKDFTKIIGLLRPGELQDLFYALGLCREDIETAEADADYAVGKARKVLQLWRTRNGRLATRRALVDAMKDCEFYHQLHNLKKCWNLKEEDITPENLASTDNIPRQAPSGSIPRSRPMNRQRDAAQQRQGVIFSAGDSENAEIKEALRMAQAEDSVSKIIVKAEVEDIPVVRNCSNFSISINRGQHKREFCSLEEQTGQVDSASSQTTPPHGTTAVPFLPYNHLKIVIKKQISEEMLKDLKALCRSESDNQFGIPAEYLAKIKDGNGFLELLEQCGLLSSRNVLYLQYLFMTLSSNMTEYIPMSEELLEYAHSYGEYQQHRRNVLYIKPVLKSIVRGAFKTEIEIGYDIHGDTRHLENLNADELMDFLVQRLGIPRRLVEIIGVLRGSVKLVIQFPRQCDGVRDVRKKLYEMLEACEEPVLNWIKKFNIYGIHIKQMEYIVFKRIQPAEIVPEDQTSKAIHSKQTTERMDTHQEGTGSTSHDDMDKQILQQKASNKDFLKGLVIRCFPIGPADLQRLFGPMSQEKVCMNALKMYRFEEPIQSSGQKWNLHDTERHLTTSTSSRDNSDGNILRRMKSCKPDGSDELGRQGAKPKDGSNIGNISVSGGNIYGNVSTTVYEGSKDTETSESHRYDFDQIQAALKENYSQNRSKLPFLPGVLDHCRSMANLFVELELEEPVEGSRTRIRKLKSCGEVAYLKNRSGKRLNRILVKGNPGIGKTSFVSKLAYDWASNPSESRSEYDLVLVIDLRKIQTGHSLLETVQDQLLTQVSLKDLAECTSPERSVLWLFDGYDGAPTAFLNGKCGNVKDVWESRALSTHSVIVTTRLNKVSHFIQKYGRTGQYSHVRVTGFSESKMVKYVGKHFNLNNTEQWLLPFLYMIIPLIKWHSLIERGITFIFGQGIHLLMHLKNSPKVRQLSQFPLFLSMLCVVWEKNEELPTNVSALERELTMYLAKFGDNKFLSKTDMEKFHQILLGTRKVSLQDLFKWHFELPGDEENENLSDTFKLGLVVKDNANLSFLLKTFQELCAAVFWVSLAEENEDKFQEYLRRIDKENYEEVKYLLRLCCGADTKAARLVLDHCVDLMVDVVRKTFEQTSSELCLLDVGSPGKPVLNPWKLPLSLLFEAESQQRAESLHSQLKPIVSMIKMHSGRKIPDQEMKTIIEHYLDKNKTGSSQTWLSFVLRAECTFHGDVDPCGIYVNLLRNFSELRVLHISGQTSCDFSTLVRELKTCPAVRTKLTELTIARCFVNCIELLELLFSLPHSCKVKLSIVKLFERSDRERPHFPQSIGSILLQLEGEEEGASDFSLLFKALTLFPYLELQEFHCLQLSVEKSILCDCFASLPSIPHKMSFRHVNVGNTRSATEDRVDYDVGKLSISGPGAPGYFDCTTWIQCFTSCHIETDSIVKFHCIDCFVHAETLQVFVKKYTGIQSLELHLYKPQGYVKGIDFKLDVVGGKMKMMALSGISEWLWCLKTWYSARDTLKELHLFFGSLDTNDLLHFLTQKASVTLVFLTYVKLTQVSNGATNATSTVARENDNTFTSNASDTASTSDASPDNQQHCDVECMILAKCPIDSKSLVSIISESPGQLSLIDIQVTDPLPESGFDSTVSRTKTLLVAGDKKCKEDIFDAAKSFEDIYNALVRYDTNTFSDCSNVFDILSHTHFVSPLELLEVDCCKLTAQCLNNFVCQTHRIKNCLFNGVTLTGTVSNQPTPTTNLEKLGMVGCNLETNTMVSFLSHKTLDTLHLYQTFPSETDGFKTVFHESNGIDADYVEIYPSNLIIPTVSSAASSSITIGSSRGSSILCQDEDGGNPDVANTVFNNNYLLQNDHQQFKAYHSRKFPKEVSLAAHIR